MKSLKFLKQFQPFSIRFKSTNVIGKEVKDHHDSHEHSHEHSHDHPQDHSQEPGGYLFGRRVF